MDTKEDVLAYLEVALEENDLEFLFKAIGDVARSKGMAQIAKELNLNRVGLYQALSEKGNPSFATMIKVLDNLGYRLQLIRKTA
jgi:probable addiction module antidote protein